MFRLARSPPLAVTSQTSAIFATALAARVAVVPLTAKSIASTFATSSLNVTRHVRVSAFVSDSVGSWRSIDVTRGAVVSRAGTTGPTAALVSSSVVRPSSVKLTSTFTFPPTFAANAL